MVRTLCGSCMEETCLLKEQGSISFNLKGEAYSVEGPLHRCEHCGEIIVDEFYEDLRHQAYEKYRADKGLVSAAEMKKIRTSYGNMSQVLFAKALGVGAATIARYELGYIPSKAYSDLIKRCQDPAFFEEVAEQQRAKMSPGDFRTIISAVRKRQEAVPAYWFPCTPVPIQTIFQKRRSFELDVLALIDNRARQYERDEIQKRPSLPPVTEGLLRFDSGKCA